MTDRVMFLIIGVVLISMLVLTRYTDNKIRSSNTTRIDLLIERANVIDALDDKILKYNSDVLIHNQNIAEGKKQLKR